MRESTSGKNCVRGQTTIPLSFGFGELNGLEFASGWCARDGADEY